MCLKYNRYTISSFHIPCCLQPLQKWEDKIKHFTPFKSYSSSLNPLHGAPFFFFLFLQNKASASSQGTPALQSPALAATSPATCIGKPHAASPPDPSTALPSPLRLVLFSLAWGSPSSLTEIHQSFPPSHLIHRATVVYQTRCWEAETRRERWLALIWVVWLGWRWRR